MIISLLLINNSMRDIARVSQVSCNTILRLFLFQGAQSDIRPSRKHYTKVQVDEFWTFVKTKKQKVWVIYAYSPDEVLA